MALNTTPAPGRGGLAEADFAKATWPDKNAKSA